jgi:biotin operon repressor
MPKKETPLIDRVYKALTTKPQSGAAIAAKLDAKPDAVRKALAQLVTDGRALHNGKKARSSAYTRAK